MKRQVFYGFHYGNEVMRVQQIRNMGVIEGNTPVSPNEWVHVQKGAIHSRNLLLMVSHSTKQYLVMTQSHGIHMEYKANIFVAQASLPDETILEYIQRGYDIQQIARSMDSDINLRAASTETTAKGMNIN